MGILLSGRLDDKAEEHVKRGQGPSLARFPERCLDAVLVCFCCFDEHQDQKQLGEQRVHLADWLESIIRDARAGLWRQQLVQRPQRNAASCLAPLACLYSPGPPA